MTPTPYPNNILMFLHCAECLKDRPEDQSPRDYIHVEVGQTKDGIQVWCIRHEMNVLALDFKGQKVVQVA